MPVLAHDMTPWKMQPPLTIGDEGQPTTSILRDTHRLLDLLEDERHLVAETLLASIQQRLDKKAAAELESQRQVQPQQQREEAAAKTKHFPKLGFHAGRKGGIMATHGAAKRHAAEQLEQENRERQEAQALLLANKAKLEKLKNVCPYLHEALTVVQDTSTWKYATSYSGITTYFRSEPDGSLSIKLQGSIEGVPLFEQIAVIKELDLFYKWAPFCTSSLSIADLDKLDVVGWFMTGLPTFGISRDSCVRAMGSDCTAEMDKIIIVARGVQDLPTGAPPHVPGYMSEDPVLDNVALPPWPTRRTSGRITIRRFDAVVHVDSPTKATTTVVANVNPNMAFLPQVLLDFCLKHLAGVLLYKLQGAATKAAKHPVSNPHAQRMRQNAAFYRDWLLVKFQAICDGKGWTLPPIPAFNLTPEEKEKAQALSSRKAARRAVTFSEGQLQSTNSSSRADSFDADMVDAATAPVAPRSRISRAATAPAVLDDNDTADATSVAVSELSTRSALSLALRNNPISNLLREQERRKDNAKEEELVQVRQMAADRLKPKAMSAPDARRLEELRLAMERRQKSTNGRGDSSKPLDGNSNVGSTTTSTNATGLADALVNRLHDHGRRTRFFVVTLFVVLLFMMLNPHLSLLLMKLPTQWIDSLGDTSSSSWWLVLMGDVGTILYMFACATLHSVLCDISLIYSFDALEVGAKAGRQARNFYVTNVRAYVAMSSFGICGASVIKAILRVLMRAIIWALATVLDASGVLEVLPPYVDAGRMAMDQFVFSSRAWIIPTNFLMRYVVHSNMVGRTIESIFATSWALLCQWTARISASSRYAVAAFRGEVEVVPWRIEAFHFCGYLYSYTAVFLVTLLILFNLSARKAVIRAHTNVAVDAKPDVSSQTNHARNVMSRSRSNTSSLISFATIPETEAGLFNQPNRSVDGASTSRTSGSGGSKSWRKLRFRRKGKTNSNGVIPPTR